MFFSTSETKVPPDENPLIRPKLMGRSIFLSMTNRSGRIGFLRPTVGGTLPAFIDTAMAAVLIPPEEKLSPTAPLRALI